VAKTRKKRQNPRGGLDDALGVVMAAGALVAGAGAALKTRAAEKDRAAVVAGPGTASWAAAPTAEEVLPVQPDPEQPPKGIKGKLYALGDRFTPLKRALEVQDRYSDLHGNNLAAAVTFQAFVSLFPLLLVAVAVVGFIAGNGTDVAGKVIGQLGLNGDAAKAVTDAVTAAKGSKKAASAIGLISLFWSGLGLVNAIQYAYNQVWQVQERGLKDKAVGMLWLGGGVVLFVGAAMVTTVLRWLPGYFAPLGIVVALGVNLILWIWTAKILPNTNLPWRAVIPGSILAAIGLEILKAVGAFYVPKAVASSSQLYGTLGVVFALLAWLFFFGRLIVYSATLNVVLWERKVGTVKVVTEVPRQPGADRGEQVTRMGRLKSEQAGKDGEKTKAGVAADAGGA
jgi:YihY family inner membrane protein